tara:strand:- start:58 stop:594 length:537 start_codon:yes stop_codon:yes gene_type:complete
MSSQECIEYLTDKIFAQWNSKIYYDQYGRYNATFQNEISRWFDCGTTNGIHYDNCYDDYDEWFGDAFRNFTDWYVSSRVEINNLHKSFGKVNIDISSEMVFDVIQLDGNCYIGDFDDIDEFNKYIVVVLLNDYLQDSDNENAERFRDEMNEIYHNTKKDKVIKDQKRIILQEIRELGK